MPCLDTTVFVDLSSRGTKKHRAAATALLATFTGPLVTTRINVAELLVGLWSFIINFHVPGTFGNPAKYSGDAPRYHA